MLPAHAPQETTAVGSPNWHVPDIMSAGRGTSVERHIVLLAVLPAGLVAVTGAVAATLLFTAGEVHVGEHVFWSLFTGTLLIICGILTGAALLAVAKARALGQRHTETKRLAARAQAELSQLRWQFDRSKELLERRRNQADASAEPVEETLDRVVDDIVSAQHAAEAAVQEMAAQELAAQTHDGQHFEVFSNMARRLESLVHREIGLLDDLENEVENPDLLKGLFRVDHLATRIRRYAENLAVLGGAVSHRMWTQPVSMADVMRSAAAEIEQYSRVKMVPPVEGTVSGHAVVDVVHLLAELVENATVFSAPQTQVLLRAEHVTAGLAIEVEDRGLGMTSAERNQMNSLLASPDGVTLAELLKDGRIGLYVVSALARRHGIAVRLQNNVYGGTQAVVVLPPELLGKQPEMTEQQQPAEAAAAPPPAPQAPAPARETPAPQRPAAAPVPEPEPAEPYMTPAQENGRPSLPKRRRQENLAPELREPARQEAAHAEPAAVADIDHDPGLMAAFRTGVRRAEDPTEPEPVSAEESRETDTTTSVGGHARPDPAR
ncbi:ATP-binding protein [Streptomyces sp. NPDC046805]|uniref:sensor histidine kinase n=1 Tax=Streptomyces sp. NPDC046805 TaxID=3155134 RepID=UPI0033CA4942